MNKTPLNPSEKKISRKEAIKKTGYMAASTATMMILLNNNAYANRNRGGHRGSKQPEGPVTSGCIK